MDFLLIIFWLSFTFVLYAYAGYPALLRVLSLFMPETRTAQSGYTPPVSLLISAYNEEDVIERKILNALESNYPKELLEIMIISDGSDDRTNEIVRRYEDRGVTLKYYPGRIGKTACLNRAVADARGEIIVFSDANSLYERNAITCMAAHFTNERIGFVTGHTKYVRQEATGISAPVGMYARLERFIKQAESRIGSCVGADGAIFAIRKRLYRQLNDIDINDFVIPLRIVGQGYKGILDERAWCTETTAGDHAGEYKRQVRITNRTLRAIMNYRDLLNPVHHGFFSVALFSHKVARFIMPFFLITLLVSTILLREGTIYFVLLAAQVLLYLCALMGFLRINFRPLAGFFSLSYAFVLMNLAFVTGWYQFMRGRTYTVWSPTKRLNEP